jgi:hypothetical protein
MGGSGGLQGSIGILRIAVLVAGALTEITPTENPPKNTSVIGG